MINFALKARQNKLWSAMVYSIIAVMGLIGISTFYYALEGPPKFVENWFLMKRTSVCGLLSAPAAVTGTVVGYTDTSIQFLDGYVLRVEKTPSLYLDRYSFFQMDQNGKVIKFALATKPFNPCNTASQ